MSDVGLDRAQWWSRFFQKDMGIHRYQEEDDINAAIRLDDDHSLTLPEAINLLRMIASMNDDIKLPVGYRHVLDRYIKDKESGNLLPPQLT